MRAKKGFTLVELLVVIAIIALLISILAPSLKIAKMIAKRTICNTNIRGAATATVIYCEVNKGLLPPVQQDTSLAGAYNLGSNAEFHRTYRAYTWPAGWAVGGSFEKVMCFGSVYEAGAVQNQDIFFCPANPFHGDENSKYHDAASTPRPWNTRPYFYQDGTGQFDEGTRTNFMCNPNVAKTATGGIDPTGVLLAFTIAKLPTDRALVLENFGKGNPDGSSGYTFHMQPTPADWGVAFGDTHVERKGSKAIFDGVCEMNGDGARPEWQTWYEQLLKTPAR